MTAIMLDLAPISDRKKKKPEFDYFRYHKRYRDGQTKSSFVLDAYDLYQFSIFFSFHRQNSPSKITNIFFFRSVMKICLRELNYLPVFQFDELTSVIFENFTDWNFRSSSYLIPGTRDSIYSVPLIKKKKKTDPGSLYYIL